MLGISNDTAFVKYKKKLFENYLTQLNYLVKVNSKGLILVNFF